MDLQTARAELKDIIGAGLEDPEADRLLNDGNKELCVRAEWTRARLALGTTVAGQSAYAMPAGVYRPQRLWVNGIRFFPADSDTADDIVADDLRLKVPGVWWLDNDINSVEQFWLYPAPSEDGLPIVARCVVFPPVLEDDDDEFTPPEDVHQGPIYYAAARAIGGAEDDLGARDYYINQFETMVGRLKRLRRMRTVSGPATMRIRGVTA